MGAMDFIRQGFNAFRLASLGQYSEESKAMRQIRAEVMEYDTSPASDKKRLRGDLRNIAADLRRAVSKTQWENKR